MALRSHSSSAWPNHVGACTPTCLLATLLNALQSPFLECSRLQPNNSLKMCPAPLDVSCYQCMTAAPKATNPLWLAAVAEGRLLAARVTQEVWGHAELLAGKARLLMPAAVLSHQPQLQHTSLVPAALPADRCCPSWAPMLSTLPAWLNGVWCQTLRLDRL